MQRDELEGYRQLRFPIPRMDGKFLTIGIGIMRVMKSVATSLPTIAHPDGIADPHDCRYSSGCPKRALRCVPHSSKPEMMKDIVQATMTRIHTMRNRRNMTLAKRCQYKKHTEVLISPRDLCSVSLSFTNSTISYVFRFVEKPGHSPGILNRGIERISESFD
jgi:hypothetical protein